MVRIGGVGRKRELATGLGFRKLDGNDRDLRGLWGVDAFG
jgi:hypothetical protein